MESHEAGFPPFPHSLEIPSGFHIPTASATGDICLLVPSQLKRRYRKGLVTDVSGPQRTAGPGTLTP